MTLGIVGAEAAKFTKKGEAHAKALIHALIDTHKPTCISSGRCHLGGIDVWAEDIAYDRCLKTLIYPPKTRQWSSGYMPRNIQIARASDLVVCLAVLRLPDGFKGMTFPSCYHCTRRKEMREHVKSGGCWTRWYAQENLKKRGELVIVANEED